MPTVTNKLIITSSVSGKRIKVEFGDYSPMLDIKKSSFIYSSTLYFELVNNETFLNVYTNGAGVYQLDINGEKGMQVGSVNGVEPLDNNHLLELLNEL